MTQTDGQGQLTRLAACAALSGMVDTNIPTFSSLLLVLPALGLQ